MSDQPHTPETIGEPPWLALYRAETERLRVLVYLFRDTHFDTESDFGKEICTIILDLAGRSAVRDFLPGSLRSPATGPSGTRADPEPFQCDCSCDRPCPFRKAGSEVRCTLSELSGIFSCSKAKALDRLHEWQEWCRLHPTLTQSVNRDIIVG